MFGDLDLHAMEEADMQDDVKDSIHRYKTPTLLFRMPRISTQNLYNSFKHLLNFASIHNISWVPSGLPRIDLTPSMILHISVTSIA